MTEALDRNDWTLGEVLDAHREAMQNELHTALVGRVQSYDVDQQTAEIELVQQRALSTEEGEHVFERLPVLRAVPVVQLRATVGGWFVHMPIVAGDEVVVLVLERDYQRWRQTGDVAVTPDTRLHHLANAIALPGLPSRPRLMAGLPTDALVIGLDGGATIAVKSDGTVEVAGAEDLALAGNLDTALSKIAQSLDEIRTAIAGAPTVDPNYGVAAKTALDVVSPIPSTKTKGA